MKEKKYLNLIIAGSVVLAAILLYFTVVYMKKSQEKALLEDSSLVMKMEGILGVNFSFKKTAARKTEITGYTAETGATLAELAIFTASRKI